MHGEDEVDEFAAHLRLGRYRTDPTGLAQDADHMREIVARRSRTRERSSAPDTDSGAQGGADES